MQPYSAAVTELAKNINNDVFPFYKQYFYQTHYKMAQVEVFLLQRMPLSYKFLLIFHEYSFYKCRTTEWPSSKQETLITPTVYICLYAYTKYKLTLWSNSYMFTNIIWASLAKLEILYYCISGLEIWIFHRHIESLAANHNSHILCFPVSFL